MALAVIGGLLFSTVLSLVFVPAMFMLMDDIGVLIWRFAGRLIVSNAATEQARDNRSDDRKAPRTILRPPAAE
jgi:hypothetical protein